MERYFCICTLDSKPSNSALEGALMKVDKFDHDLNTFIALILHEILLSAMAYTYFFHVETYREL